MAEKEILTRVIRNPEPFRWQDDRLSGKSQRILDNSAKDTKESITLRFTDMAIDKGRTKVCILVYTEYGHKGHELVKGGGMDIVFFAKNGNSWSIEKSVKAILY